MKEFNILLGLVQALCNSDFLVVYDPNTNEVITPDAVIQNGCCIQINLPKEKK